MTQLWQYLALLAMHWIGDFVLQTHWQAQNKSKSNVALFRHVMVWGACLTVAAGLLFPSPQWLFFVWVNCILHFATDWCTSRWSSRLYAKQDWHNFFVVIGFDQLIHQATLAVTMWVLLK
jgi:hypothetical protein